jgi:hypothetical protein
MRRNGSSAFVNQLLVYALVAICGTGTLGLGTVWLRHQISIAANANRVLQSQLAEVQRRLDELGVEVAAEQDPAVLTRRNEAWHLGLSTPADAQVRRVTVDPVLRLAALHNRALFGERPTISFLGAGPGLNLGLGARAAPAGLRLAFAR